MSNQPTNTPDNEPVILATEAYASEQAQAVYDDRNQELEAYDPETGELLCELPPTFRWLPDVIETEEHLVTFLEQLQTAEAMVAAEMLRLQAIIENCQRMVAQKKRLAHFLRFKYEAQASALALALLPKKKDGTFKTKTWTCPYGSIKFVDSAEKLEVTDEPKAVEFAEAHGGEMAIKTTRELLISKLPPECKKLLMDDRDVAFTNGFDIKPATTKPKVDTGFKI